MKYASNIYHIKRGSDALKKCFSKLKLSISLTKPHSRSENVDLFALFRYVKILIPKRKDMLDLCEVEVFKGKIFFSFEFHFR